MFQNLLNFPGKDPGAISPFFFAKSPGRFPPPVRCCGEAIRSMGKAKLWCLATLFTALLLAASLAIRKTHAKVVERPGGRAGM